MKKRLFLLCAAIAALTAVSCGSAAEAGPVSEPDSSAASEQESRQEETEEPTSVVYDIPEPELPEMDYGGESFLVYTNCTQNESSPDLLFPPAKFLFSEGLNGEIVNDTVFNRNLAVEQKFNIKFNFIQKATLPDILIAAGEPFDLVMSVSNSISERIDTGAYLNMYGFPYLSLDAEYWFPSAVDGFLVDDLLYFLPCDISMDHLAATGFFYFNKRILAEHDLPNPYELVYSDNWTLDTFLEMVKQVHGDLNGDGVMDMEDLYGCLHKGEWGDAVFFQFYFGSGLTYTKWDPNDGRVLNFNAEKAQGIIDKLWDTLEDRNFCLSDEVISRITSTSHWDSELY
ncbi:MAG: hypothetical protein II719_06430, partial [Clostridia bacterium]|nr:hypothetical protein [Clostridia bacterium]